MFIDIHVHPAFYEPIQGSLEREVFRHKALNLHLNETATLEHIFNQMRCAGLDKLCLLAQDYTSTSGGEVVTNEEVQRLVALAPERFIGFASVDPFRKDALEILEKAFTDGKLRGLKLHPSAQCFYPFDERLEPIYNLCERYDKPILFHSGLSWEATALSKYGQPLGFESVAAAHPKLRICLAHFGWPWVRETAMLMLRYPNVYADTAVLHFDDAITFYKQLFNVDIPFTWIDRSLRHQVLFGSNNPRFEQIRMAKALDELGFRDSTVTLIKGINALDFLGGV